MPATGNADPCIFCDIVNGRAAASVVYRDERAVAIMDLHPLNPGHLLVLPAAHAAGLADLDEPTGAHLFTVAMRLARAVRRAGVRCEGVRLSLADGAAAGQDAFHVHLHVVPRYRGDALAGAIVLPPQAGRAELDEIAARLRAAYDRVMRDAQRLKS